MKRAKSLFNPLEVFVFNDLQNIQEYTRQPVNMSVDDMATYADKLNIDTNQLTYIFSKLNYFEKINWKAGVYIEIVGGC